MARILIVEDDKSMNEILVRTLSDEGHQTESALNGQSAVVLANFNTFDLVITDVRLPGIDGVEGLRQIKRIQPNVKCMVITGYTSSETPVRALKLRVDDYLVKPFGLRNFLHSVRRVLNTGNEAGMKRQLLSQLLSTSLTSLDPELEKLSLGRLEAFRGLYIGTRSGFLTRLEASEVYGNLEMLEEQYRTLMLQANPERTQVTKVRVLYAAILDRLDSFHAGLADVAPNDPAQLPTEQFTALYTAIGDSKVGLDDLLYAPILRTTSPESLQNFAELLELRGRLWPVLV